MFVPGRTDRHKKIKRTQNDLNELINEWGDEVVHELNNTSLIQLSRKQKALRDEVNRIKTSYDLLLSSSSTYGLPNITIHSNLNENQEMDSSCHTTCKCKGNDLSWEELRNLLIIKCKTEREHTNNNYEKELKRLLISAFYPSVMEEDPLLSLKEDISIENYYALFIAAKYQEICKMYIREAKKLVQDKCIFQTKSTKNTVLCSYPIIYPCKWVLDFCNAVELPSVTHRTTKHQYGCENHGSLERKLYISIQGTEIAENHGSKRQNKINSVQRSYSLDLPYHMTRFLSVFGTAVLVPDNLDRYQYPKIERYTDIQLLLHFAIKNQNEELYNEFLCSELEFFQKKRHLVVTALDKAIHLLLSNKGDNIIFDVNKEGNIKMYWKEGVIESGNTSKVQGTEQPIKKRLLEVPHEVMRVLRFFILPNIDEYRHERNVAQMTGTYKNFEQKYCQWVLSPIGKLLNFDKQAQKEFTTLDCELQDTISIHRYLNPKAAFLPCVVNIYTLILQAAYSIREICDPIDYLDYSTALVLDEIIIDGDRIGYPGEVSYISVFEAFPGLFYFSTFSDTSLESIDDESGLFVKDDRFTSIFRLFENYVSFIPKVDHSKKKKLLMAEFIKPTDIRWINIEKILYIAGTCRGEICGVRSALVNNFMKKGGFGFDSNSSNWKYFITPIASEHILTTYPEIEKSYYSPNYKHAIGAFFRTPITMGIKIKMLESREEAL